MKEGTGNQRGLWSRYEFREAARHIAAVSKRIYDQGWAPATSSNFSVRLNTSYCAITTSGQDKAQLDESNIMVTNMDGQPATAGKPSAETGLHTWVYRTFSDAGAVLHTHSPACTFLTMFGAHAEQVTFQGYELQKAFTGISSHQDKLVFPVIDNDQDIPALANKVNQLHQQQPLLHGYLIRGHGLYTWATDLEHCYYQLEALEFLLDLECKRIMTNKV